MKKELIKTSFLAFAAFLIATTTNSVATNEQQRSYEEVVCKDFWGLEKLFRQAKSAEGESIPLNVKTKCSKKDNESYVRNDNFKFDRSSSAINRNF